MFLKGKKSLEIDETECMGFKFGFGKYLRAIRVYFISNPNPNPIRSVELNHRDFFPERKALERNEFESFDSLFETKIKPFLKINRQSKVINFELVLMNDKESTENMIKNINQNLLIACIRIYFNGPLTESFEDSNIMSNYFSSPNVCCILL